MAVPMQYSEAHMDLSQSLLLNHEREDRMVKKGMFVVSNGCKSPGLEKLDMEVDLEEALDFAGVGKYQAFHLGLMLLALVAAILEIIGNAFILPAAACDLNVPDSLKGLLTSVPNIGVILTAPLWGRAADALGRKQVLLWSSLTAGIIGLIAAAMPNLLSYALTKFVASLFLACPSSISFAYMGELTARRRRDLAVLLLSGLLNLLTVLSPVLAWIILSKSGSYTIGSLSLHPWRLLTASYAAPLVLAGLWMTQAMESPKFLVAKGRRLEALEVLRKIYAKNTGNPPERFCVSSIKASPGDGFRDSVDSDSAADLTAKVRSESALALLRPPHLRWFALISFLMAGVFSSLNGLFLFAPDTINKVLNEDAETEGTICVLMNMADSGNSTSPSCVDTISRDTFLIMVVTSLVYGVIVLAISMCPVSKKTLLVGMYAATGLACLLAGVLTNRMVAGAMMSALQLAALGIGPLTAYAVHLFPTSLRGTAVGACLMFGRLGSISGANIAGSFLHDACSTVFYGFTALLMLCLMCSFLLPKEELIIPRSPETSVTSNMDLDHDQVSSDR